MIEKEDSKQEIRRLQSLKFFPQDDKAIGELVIALQCAEDLAIAKSVITELVETMHDCPVPADIRRAVFAKQEKSWEQEPAAPSKTPYCPTCKGNGMVKQDGKWDRCACLAGQEYPQSLIDMQNVYEGKKPPSHGKSEKDSRRYVDRVLIR